MPLFEMLVNRGDNQGMTNAQTEGTVTTTQCTRCLTEIPSIIYDDGTYTSDYCPQGCDGPLPDLWGQVDKTYDDPWGNAR